MSDIKGIEHAELAEYIATRLLTCNRSIDTEVECTRMQLMLKKADEEQNMGGRNKQSMINEIFDCLSDWEGRQ